ALFTPAGRIIMRNAQYAEDPEPVQADCTCYTCRTFSRAYLRHLYKVGEITALRLGTIHNVHFLMDLMRQIRSALRENRYDAFRTRFLATYQRADQERRHDQHARKLAARGAGIMQ